MSKAVENGDEGAAIAKFDIKYDKTDISAAYIKNILLVQASFPPLEVSNEIPHRIEAGDQFIDYVDPSMGVSARLDICFNADLSSINPVQVKNYLFGKVTSVVNSKKSAILTQEPTSNPTCFHFDIYYDPSSVTLDELKDRVLIDNNFNVFSFQNMIPNKIKLSNEYIEYIDPSLTS